MKTRGGSAERTAKLKFSLSLRNIGAKDTGFRLSWAAKLPETRPLPSVLVACPRERGDARARGWAAGVLAKPRFAGVAVLIRREPEPSTERCQRPLSQRNIRTKDTGFNPGWTTKLPETRPTISQRWWRFKTGPLPRSVGGVSSRARRRQGVRVGSRGPGWHVMAKPRFAGVAVLVEENQPSAPDFHASTFG